MPEFDLTKAKFVRRNPYAAKIRKDGGYTVSVDGKKSYFVRVGAGRPKTGEKTEPTTTLTLRLPVSVLEDYKSSAKAKKATLNAELVARLASRRRQPA